VELRDYLRLIRRRWALIVFTTLIGLAAAVALTVTATPQYSSSARLFVSTTDAGQADAYQGSLFSAQRVTSYADLVSSREVAATVISELDLASSTSDLASKVTAEVVPDTVILELTATDSSAARARLIAQSYAEAMVDLVRQLETPADASSAPIKATIVDAASEPRGAVSPQPVRNVGLGLVLGLLLGLLGAAARDFLDSSIKEAGDLAHASEAPVLATIAFDSAARKSPLITALDSHAPRVEAFRVLRTNLQFIDVDTPDKVFVVTSPLPGEGKTTTAVNLAITMAQSGRRTVLVECDLRRPRAGAALEMDSSIGVTTILLGKVTLDDAIQKHDASDLHVVGSGAIPPNPAELIQSNAMADFIAELRERYDMVVLDAPPLLPVTDAALLAAHSDGALMVVRYNKTTRDQFAQAIDRLKQVDAAAVGVLLNMVPTRRRHGGYGYGYGYGYAPVDAGTRTSKTTRKSRRH
jgi:capsular exopolysaccharide synthesis family protein